MIRKLFQPLVFVCNESIGTSCGSYYVTGSIESLGSGSSRHTTSCSYLVRYEHVKDREEIAGKDLIEDFQKGHLVFLS